MTALQTLQSALSIHDDPPSDEFEFESEYVKSLLRQRTPSPAIHKGTQSYTGKENIERWKTPVTLGAASGRTILGQRDVNSSGFNRSASVIGIPGESHETPAVKLSSSQPAPSGSTRYPRRGRLTRLGPPKRASRLSSDSLETSENDTPPNAERPLSTIPSTGTEPKGLRGLIQLQHQVASLNVNGQFTPPASQSPPKQFEYRESTPPVESQSPKVTPFDTYRRTSSSSSGSSVSSASKSLGRSSLRQLLASTTPARDMVDAIEEVQKGLEALNAKKLEEKNELPSITPRPQILQPRSHERALSYGALPSERARQVSSASSKTAVERDITQEYVPPRGVNINTLPTRRKSSPPQHREPSPPSHIRPPSPKPVKQPSPIHRSPSPKAPSPKPPSEAKPPKMRQLETDKPPSPKTGKAVITVNNRPYTRLSTIGRGGSSKVYKVISPTTNKIYALKKVSFDKADASAIMGYKNEIRLLNRMAERDESKCIRLFDWESCDEKGYLLMLMECGEIDFAHILAKYQGTPLSLNFIRVYWEQMLSAVQAIHEEKIVHSDLKPANFLLVQGQLKLIDFGIAKRMGDDTTNIHRDQQIGTVNYMSPEAILDTNQSNPHLAPGAGRLMKLGKKSDVWSLGCILYQMLYGKTPFSDLTMYQKIQSIPDEKYPIKFPPTGTGGVTLDAGAIRCVRMCLVRDQKKRWGIEELLCDRFLCGEVEDDRFVGITVDEIGSLIEQTLGFGRMNNGKPLPKDTIESLAKVSFTSSELMKDAFEKLKATRMSGYV